MKIEYVNGERVVKFDDVIKLVQSFEIERNDTPDEQSVNMTVWKIINNLKKVR
jgi:hypothetical protein